MMGRDYRFFIANQLHGLHAGDAGGVEFFTHIGQEHHLLAGQLNLAENGAIRRRFAFAPYSRIKVSAEQRCEIAVVRVTKDQLLRLDRTRGINVKR